VLALSGDVEGTTFDIGTTSVRLVRAGNVVQVLFSNPLEAKFLYRQLFERHKRELERMRGG
jgi:hypothetical protein